MNGIWMMESPPTPALSQLFVSQLKEFVTLVSTQPDLMDKPELQFFSDFCLAWSRARDSNKAHTYPRPGVSFYNKDCNDFDSFKGDFPDNKEYLDVVVKEEDDQGNDFLASLMNDDHDQDFMYDDEDEERKPKAKKMKKEKKEKVKKERVKKEKKGNKYNSQQQCQECGDILSTTGALVLHIKAKHEGVKYSCHLCEQQYTTMGNLKVHIAAKHEGKKYQCEYCEYRPAKQFLLAKHIQIKHMGYKVKCDQCDFETNRKDNLKLHVRAIHEGIRHSCDQCGYSAIRPENLRAHIRDVHENLTFLCKTCPFQTNRKRKLNDHLRSMHGDIVPHNQSFAEFYDVINNGIENKNINNPMLQKNFIPPHMLPKI